MLDPLSFTASLVTVGGVVVTTSKILRDVRVRLKDPPKEVESLLKQWQIFQNLFEQLQIRLQANLMGTPTQDTLQQRWGDSLAQMEEDVKGLHTEPAKVEKLLKKKTLRSKIMLPIQQMLSEESIARYQKNLDTHCKVLASIKQMVCE